MLKNDQISKMIERVRLHEPHALDDFLTTLAPTLHRFGLRMCKNEEDAQDIAQESLLAAVNNLETYRSEASASTWLYTIARNFCAKKRRRSKFAPHTIESLQAVDLDKIETSSNAQEILEQKQFEAALNQALDVLDSGQKEAFILRDLEGLSAKEAADTLKLSESALKSKLHRARDNVRKKMTPWFEANTNKTATKQVTNATKCPQTKDISIFFSKYLEGDLDPLFCSKLKSHVNECVDCKPICDCMEKTLKLCAQTKFTGPANQKLISKIHSEIGKCQIK